MFIVTAISLNNIVSKINKRPVVKELLPMMHERPTRDVILMQNPQQGSGLESNGNVHLISVMLILRTYW